MACDLTAWMHMPALGDPARAWKPPKRPQRAVHRRGPRVLFATATGWVTRLADARSADPAPAVRPWAYRPTQADHGRELPFSGSSQAVLCAMWSTWRVQAGRPSPKKAQLTTQNPIF